MGLPGRFAGGIDSPLLGRRPQNLVLHGHLPDLALGLPQRPVVAEPVRPLALLRLVAAGQEVVAQATNRCASTLDVVSLLWGWSGRIWGHDDPC
jgi:hypothetical protein